MCPPVLIVGAVLMVAAASLTAVQGIQQGNAQQKQAKAQAKYIQNANAVQTVQRNQQRDALISQQRAVYGAAGLDASDLGTPGSVYAATAGQAAQDQYRADIGAHNDAETTKVQGENDAIEAKNSAFTSIIGAAGQALTSLGGGAGAAAGAAAGATAGKTTGGTTGGAGGVAG